MPKQIVIAEQHRLAAVFSEDQIQELVVATGSHQIGDIYLGVVENVLPGIDAAFVNIGDAERNGFIHVSDLGPLKLKRTAGPITELLLPQQKVLVQVMKEPTGNKGPRLTGNVTLPGRYLVLLPYGRGVSLSRRIESETERSHLRALAILIKPAGMGLLVRTEAEGVSEEAIIKDLEALQMRWESILQEASSNRAPALLNRDDDFIQRVLRDFYTDEINRIVVDSQTGLKRIKQQLSLWNRGKADRGVLVDYHAAQDEAGKQMMPPILEYFRVNAAIREALKPRVDLPSGGYIIIERTEALTVVDVNSGSFIRSATARETVLWTNFEAATEIARQLRLRNIAGVIVVDFIDMDSRRDQIRVLERFTEALRADKAKPQIAQLSELGLVELTRKRQGQDIYELFGRACPTCGGLGHLAHLPGEEEESSLEQAIVAGDSRSAREARLRSGSSSQARRGRSRRSLPSSPGAPVDLMAPSLDVADLPLRPVVGRDVPLLEEETEQLEPDLLNHPDYQEQSGTGNSSRRRRRRANGGRVARQGSRSESRSEPGARRSSRDDRSRRFRNGGLGQETLMDSSPDEAKDADLELSQASVGKNVVEVVGKREPREGRSDRRAARREGGRANGQPELVAITMTADEQDVYAFMGLSPLGLATEEVKDARSAVVSIFLPGEAPPGLTDPVEQNGDPEATSAQLERDDAVNKADEEDELDQSCDPTDDELDDTSRIEDALQEEGEDDQAFAHEAEAVDAQPEQLVLSAEDERTETEEGEDTDPSSTFRRRRRRRSSAS